MQKFKFNINGKSYEAIVEETERNTARVELNGKSYTVQVEKEEAIVSPKIAAVKPSSTGGEFVDAPAQPITGNAGSIMAWLKSPVMTMGTSGKDWMYSSMTRIWAVRSSLPPLELPR